MSQHFEDADERGPPSWLVDPYWSVLNDLGSVAKIKYLHRQFHHLAHAVKHEGLIVRPGHTVTIDQYGFISVVGAPPVTEDILRQPRITFIHGDQGRENLGAMISPLPSLIVGAELQRRYPRVEDVMRIIESSPHRRHYVWFALYAKLSADRPDIPEKTSEGLLRAVMRSIRQERAAWSKLEVLSRRNPRIEDLVMVSPQILSDAICELAGISKGDSDADPLLLLAERDEELWEWARDLETGLERLVEQASRVRRGHSENMVWRRAWILQIWAAIHEMLVQGKMEPQLCQLLGDLELYAAHVEEDPLPSRPSSPERGMIGSLPWSPDLEEEEAAQTWGRSNDYSSIDVNGEGLERPYSLHADTAQDQEISREVPQTVIDLTGLDD